MNLRPRGKVNADFSSSSMTDIIFLLLIFFIIISSVVKDPALKVILPKGAPTKVVNEVINVTVDANLQYAVNENIVSYDRLPSALRSALSSKPGATVSIYGDKTVEYDEVMKLVKMADDMDAKVVLALAKD
ncbi:biopolymer transporter ExbD [bacterium]|nr:biopolymer transporter ExbD [bacterium]